MCRKNVSYCPIHQRMREDKQPLTLATTTLYTIMVYKHMTEILLYKINIYTNKILTPIQRYKLKQLTLMTINTN